MDRATDYRKKDWRDAMLGCSISGILILPLIALIYFKTHVPILDFSDFPAHIYFAQDLTFKKIVELGLPHLIPHVLINKVQPFSGLSLNDLFFLVTSCSMLITTFLKVALIRAAKTPLRAASVGLLAGFSSIAGALYLPFFHPEPYIGVWSPLILHNPTGLWLKTFVAVVIVMAAKTDLFEHMEKLNKAILLSALLIGTFIKPNFAIMFLPAMFLWWSYRKNLSSIAFYLCPIMVILGLQFIFTFGKGDSSVGFSWAGPWSQHSRYISVAIFQNLAGPIVLSAYIYRQKLWDKILSFLWVMTLISLAQGLFFAEFGRRFQDMNFIWGYTVIVEFVFLYACCIFLKIKDRSKVANLVVSIVLLAHLFSGIVFLTYFQYRSILLGTLFLLVILVCLSYTIFRDRNASIA